MLHRRRWTNGARAVSPRPGTRRKILSDEAAALRTRIATAQASPALTACALGRDHEDITRCAHFRRTAADLVG